MATEYPGGLDDFQITTDPANTPLSQRGTGGLQNHVESHTNMGDAIEALQVNAALKTHDHSGTPGGTADRTKGYKLRQSNTHESADTDNALTSIHHTLGTNLPTSGTTGQYQAAPANHTHEYSTLNNTPLIRCTSGSRPTGVAAGTLIYETNTGCVRILRDSAWLLTTIGKTPIVRLRQTQGQNISSGTLVQWDQAIEDTFSWASAPTTTITIPEAGLYHFNGAIQWNPSWVPDNSTATVMVNNTASDLTVTKYQKQGLGLLAPAGFTQTLPISGHLRLTAGAQVSLKCTYDAPGSILGFIASFFDNSSNVKSRLDITFVAP